MKSKSKPIVTERHDSITVDFGGGRKLRAGRYSDRATGSIPKTVFFAFCALRDAKGGTYGQRIAKFADTIERIWPSWTKGGTPKPKKAAPKSIADKYGKDAVRALQMGMKDAAERNALPARFMQKEGPAGNCVILLDTKTGRTVEVGLCDLHGARAVLRAFFG